MVRTLHAQREIEFETQSFAIQPQQRTEAVGMQMVCGVRG